MCVFVCVFVGVFVGVCVCVFVGVLCVHACTRMCVHMLTVCQYEVVMVTLHSPGDSMAQPLYRHHHHTTMMGKAMLALLSVSTYLLFTSGTILCVS